MFRIEALTSNKQVNAYETLKNKELTEVLEKLIVKNKQLDSKYSLAFASNTKDLELAIEKAKEDNKNLAKSAQNVSVSTDVVFTTYKGTKAFVDLNFENPAALKNTAITLREAHKDAIIIIGSQAGGKTTLVVASKIADSKKLFDEIANGNGRGGGNAEFAMGSVNGLEKLDV